jgi:hypothetical protein
MHNKFPEVFNRNKTIDEDGYPVYRRRNGGRYIEQGEVMLSKVKGCTSFKDIRTVNGVVHTSYTEALGFLDDDKEWIDCINEASSWATGNQLQQLFTTILCHCEVKDPKTLWGTCWEVLSEDMEYRQRKNY